MNSSDSESELGPSVSEVSAGVVEVHPSTSQAGPSKSTVSSSLGNLTVDNVLDFSVRIASKSPFFEAIGSPDEIVAQTAKTNSFMAVCKHCPATEREKTRTISVSNFEHD